MRILVCEDNPEIAELLSELISERFHDVRLAFTGEACLEEFSRFSPHLLILDLMLPGMSGEEVLADLRATSSVPVIVLTAKRRQQDKVDALSMGADDYVEKPFSNEELLARIDANLRRCYPAEPSPITIDNARKQIKVRGESVHLSPKEYQLVSLLASNPGKVFSPQEILERLWSDSSYATSQDVQKYIYLVRKKIEDDPGDPELILTVRGFGYRLSER